jgi:hypothetical protein
MNQSTEKAWKFISEQGWEDCEELADAASARNFPAREEAAVVFARGCEDIREGTADFISLKNTHRLICLKVFNQDKPIEASPTTPQPRGSHPSPEVPLGFGQGQNGMSPEKSRRDAKDVYEKITLDPDDKDILYMQEAYRYKKTKQLADMVGHIPDALFPSDKFWGRLEKMYRDKGFFQKLDWGKVEARSKNKFNAEKAKSGLSFTLEGKLKFEGTDNGVPRTLTYLWNTISCIMYGLWLSGFSTDWNKLRAFHDHFKISMENQISKDGKYTRAHEIPEIITSYENAMELWEDRTRLIYLGEQVETDVKCFDDILVKMTPQDNKSYESFFLCLAPRIKTGPSGKGAGGGGVVAKRTAAARDTPVAKKTRLRIKPGKGKGQATGKGTTVVKTTLAAQPFSLWQGYKSQSEMDKAKHAAKLAAVAKAKSPPVTPGPKKTAKAGTKGAKGAKSAFAGKPCYFHPTPGCNRGEACPFKH